MSDVGEPDQHVWTRWVIGWHVAFWLLTGLAVLWALFTAQLSSRERLQVLGLLGALAVAYTLLIQRRTRALGWPAHLYLGIAIAVTGLGCAIHPTMSMLLFIAYAQVWMFTRRLAVGALYAAALTVATTAGFLTRFGWTTQMLRELAPQFGVGLAFSLLLGVWISRIINESMDRAALIEALESARGELAAADHARGVVAERERIAREIHDTLAQGFTSIVMLAQAAAAEQERNPARVADRLAAIEDVARENLAEARGLVAAFSPVSLDGGSLADAVDRLTRRFATETGLDVEVLVADAPELTREQEVVLLRAVQESLANVRRHARARRVVVRLSADGTGTRVEVGDDGVGFENVAGAAGFGLAGMRSRVGEVGGELDVASAPGAGTRVVVRLPAVDRAAVPEHAP